MLFRSRLVGVFIYWGWESAVNLSEESKDSDTAPGRAGLWSTIILVVTYLGVGIVTIAVAGVDFVSEYEDDDALFGALGDLADLQLAIARGRRAQCSAPSWPVSRA